MVSIGLLTLTLITCGVLITLGFYFKQRALFLSLGGGVILAVLGILMLGGPGIDFATGTTITTINSSLTVEETVFSTTNDGVTQMFSWVVFLIGFSTFVGSAMGLNKRRYETDDLDDDVMNDPSGYYGFKY